MSTGLLRQQLRSYQKEIGDLGTKKNLIACLPTGSGKTLIAVYLMTTSDIRKKVLNGLKIVFIVNTVSLAHQQAKYIEENSRYKTLCCTGQSSKSNNVDTQWKLNIKACEVIVMTSQYCFDKIAHGFLNFSQLALLVLDECHHVSKNHPMKKIMELYKVYQDNNPTSLPRILGLSASIVKRSKTAGAEDDKVARAIAIMEKQMFSKAVTYDDFEELRKFSTKPTLITVVYPDICGPLWADGKLVSAFADVRKLVDRRCSSSVDLRILEEARVNRLPNFSLRQVFRSNAKHDFYSDLGNTLDDFLEIYKELGPLGAQKLAETRLSWMNEQLNRFGNEERAIFVGVKTQFQLFIAKVISLTVDEQMKVRLLDDLVSYKVRALMRCLSKFKGKEGTNALLGLIFVKRRSCALSLKALIEEFVQVDPTTYGFLKPGLVTGTNNIKKENFETRVSTAQQKITLEQFRDRKLNLIVCTTVLEEGIDVPECNLVVRFDELQAYHSYVQSMGRARKSSGEYHVFTSTTESQNNANLIAKFMCLQNTINKALVEDQSADVILFDDETNSNDEDEIQDFSPMGSSGPTITSSAAIQLVNRFCQRSEKQLKVFSWWTLVSPDLENVNSTYQGYVWIQDNPYIRDCVVGPKTKTLVAAKKAAYLKVCEELYIKGALDKHLFPK